MTRKSEDFKSVSGNSSPKRSHASIMEEVVLDPPEDDDDEDDDDIMNDPDIREMVENGEHICHMFDAHCQACEKDEEDQVIQKVDQLRAHFC